MPGFVPLERIHANSLHLAAGMTGAGYYGKMTSPSLPACGRAATRTFTRCDDPSPTFPITRTTSDAAIRKATPACIKLILQNPGGRPRNIPDSHGFSKIPQTEGSGDCAYQTVAFHEDHLLRCVNPIWLVNA